MSEALLERALAAIEALQARVEQLQAAAREPIAVVGMGCRFPGADDPGQFARWLQAGGDAVREVPPARAAEFSEAPPALRVGGFLDDVAGFDAAFFGLAAQEARAMDPQQRLLLEVAWQALDDAGAAGGALAGSRTGVWLGLGAQNTDYAWRQLDAPNGAAREAIAGSFHSLMPGRLSYLLDLRGPSLVVDAACASGLVVVHQACESLRRGECDAAIAAAVNLVLSPRVSAAVAANGLWSSGGRSRAFDAAADGFVRGEGGAALLLMRLSDAQRQGHRIHAVIAGSACGQDGRSNGLTAPSGPAQVAVIQAALRAAGLAPHEVGYVEAHATGTRLGDAIEAQALAEAYGPGRAGPLPVGALKPALGHLEAASGLAALLKAILAVEQGVLAPTLHHHAPSAELAMLQGALEIVSAARAWAAPRRVAAVSAFGMSGSNAHVLVAQAPAAAVPHAVPEDAPCAPATLRLSAATEPALRAWAARLAAAELPSWPALCEAVARGRKAFPLAARLTAASLAQGRALLRDVALGALSPTREPPAPPAEAQAAGWTRIALPAYPWDRQPFWLDDAAPAMATLASRWVPAAAPAATGAAGGPVLLLGDGALAQRCADALAAHGVQPAHASSAAVHGAARLWIWCLPAPAPQDAAAAARAVQVLDTLARLLAARAADAASGDTRLLLVTPPTDTDPVAAAAAGLWRVAAVEHPELAPRHLELSDAVAGDPALLASLLLEAGGAPWLRLAADGRLLQPRPQPLQPVIGADGWQAPRGCCLVTGAFGGVGPALAAWLVARGARDLLLLGRHPRELPAAAAWQAAGVRLRLVQADVADAPAVAAALAGLDAEGVPLAGVFHAAGVTADGLLAQQDAARIAAVLRPKLQGALVLDRLTRGRPLQAFVLFGSITARIPLAGTATYAAANAALEALARARAAAGLPALCVHWGTWAGGGMAARADAAVAAQWDAHGIHPFAPAAGLQALGELLAAGADVALAGRFDWQAVRRQDAAARGEVPGPLQAPREAAAPLAPTPPQAAAPALVRAAASDHELPTLVRHEVAAVLGLRADDPRLDLPFGELGLGSLAAVELKTRLGLRLGLAVPATLAFNHPSVAAVAAFLARRLRAAAASQAEPVPAK